MQEERDGALRAAAKEFKRRARSPTTELVSETEAEVPPAPAAPKPKKRVSDMFSVTLYANTLLRQPRAQEARVQEVEVSDGRVESVPPVTKSKKRVRTTHVCHTVLTHMVQPRTQDASASEEEDERPRKRSGQSRAPKVDMEDERPPPRAKGKAKPSSRASQEPEAVAKRRQEKPSSTARDKPPSSKPPSVAGKRTASGSSKLTKETVPEEDAQEEQQEPKKKRKIFLPATQPMTFDWVPQQDGGLDIPTALSPIKESAPESKSFLRKVFSFG